MPDLQVERGSFRDRHARVFYCDGRVYRGLSAHALQQWETVSGTAFFHRAIEERKLVRTERVAPHVASALDDGGHWAGILEHERIPFVTYPYEWCFAMLKDAALLQLDLLARALDEDMILKDASAYNIQWLGTNPVFVDVASFETLLPGEPWVGYRQFCQMFLYPLLLQAYKDVPFQPWLRGNIDGIPPADLCNLMSIRDLLRPGVFHDVYVQTKLQSWYGQSQRQIRRELREAGFSRQLIRNNVRRLTKIVCGLRCERTRSEWSHYASEHNYRDEDQQRKAAFVREAVASRRWGLVWDLGCNIGAFSRIASENASYVIAMDADALAVERLYESLKASRTSKVLPLVSNVADPSPNLGWRGLERKGLPERGKPELTLCLALLHHLVISANIPLRDFLDWLAGLETSAIIEFVTKDDPMVQALLCNKEDIYSDYERAHFERQLAEHFDVRRCESLGCGTRFLYYACAKGGHCNPSRRHAAVTRQSSEAWRQP